MRWILQRRAGRKWKTVKDADFSGSDYVDSFEGSEQEAYAAAERYLKSRNDDAEYRLKTYFRDGFRTVKIDLVRPAVSGGENNHGSECQK